MENPVLQIKDALIRVLKKIDPDTDVFFEEIKSTDPAHGVEHLPRPRGQRPLHLHQVAGCWL